MDSGANRLRFFPENILILFSRSLKSTVNLYNVLFSTCNFVDRFKNLKKTQFYQVCKTEDMTSSIKDLFSSCEKIAVREMDTIFRAGFYNVNKLIPVTLFFFLVSPVPVSKVTKTND